MQLREHKTN